ncbi:MAG: hypothetical protein WA718_19565, partial [Terriglobales bacterium]
IERGAIGISKGAASSPLRNKTGLFKTFASLPKDEDESILEFANMHGPLDRGSAGPIGKTVTLRRPKRGESAEIHYAESLDIWSDQISLMKWLVRVWDAARRKEQSFLKRFIQWEQDCVIAQLNPSLPDCPLTGMETIATDSGDPRMWSKLKQGDLLDPAMLYLQRNINKQITEFPSQVRLLWDNGRSFLFIEPTNLIGALWLQFAQAIDGDREYRVCQQCREWFEIGGGKKKDGADHHRTDARFCTNACKQKAYRAGKRTR